MTRIFFCTDCSQRPIYISSSDALSSARGVLKPSSSCYSIKGPSCWLLKRINPLVSETKLLCFLPVITVFTYSCEYFTCMPFGIEALRQVCCLYDFCCLGLLFYRDEETRTLGLYTVFIHNIYPLKMFPVCFFVEDQSGTLVT